MTTPTGVPRLKTYAYPYELIDGDLLVNEADETWRRVSSTSGTSTITVTFDDDSTQDFPRLTFLTIYRDRASMPAAYASIPPFIVA